MKERHKLMFRFKGFQRKKRRDFPWRESTQENENEYAGFENVRGVF